MQRGVASRGDRAGPIPVPGGARTLEGTAVSVKLLIMLAMVLLPVGLFVWARWRRGSSMSSEAARAGYEAARAGAPLTDELIKAVAVHTARNAYRTNGVVEAVFSRDHYAVRLDDGTPMRGTRGWKRVGSG